MKPYWDAFAFPFKRENLAILVFGLFVLSFGPWILSLVPIAGGMLSLFIDWVVLAYYGIFLHSILHTTMQGSDHIPAWPDMETPIELIGDFFSLLSPFVVSFLPLLLFRCSLAGVEVLLDTGFFLRSSMPTLLDPASHWRFLVEVPLLLLGWLYLPMAILAWTFYGGWSILNPVAVARAAWSTGPSYLLVVFLTWAMVTAAYAVSWIPGKYITTFGSSLLVFYALVVAMRLIGVHYRLNRHRLGWEHSVPDPAC